MMQTLQAQTVWVIFALAALAVIGAEVVLCVFLHCLFSVINKIPRPDAVKLLPKAAKEALRARTRWERDWAEIEEDLRR